MRIVRFVFILLCILGMAISYGCAGPKYKVNNQTFDTPEEAVNYMKALDKEFKTTITDKITPTKTPVGGKAYLFMPSKALFEKIFDAIEEKQAVKEFMVAAKMVPAKTLWERLKNRKIFDDVIYKLSDDPEKDAMAVKDTTVIYTTVLKTSAEQTFVRKVGGQPVLILLTATLKDKPLESAIYYLDQIEKAAK